MQGSPGSSLYNDKIGITVIRREGESIDTMLKRFKRKVQKSEILREYRSRVEYLKPSVAKRKKRHDARRRDARDALKLEKQLMKKQKRSKKFRAAGVDRVLTFDTNIITQEVKP